MGTTNRTGSFWPRQSKFSLLIAVALIFAVFSASSALASRGGTENRDNTFSIGFSFELGGIEQVCSGTLLSPTIIVTAAHCVIDNKGNKSTKYIFAPPGVSMDAPLDPSITYPKVIKVNTVAGYTLNDANTKDDIAFIQIDRPLASNGFIRTATATEVSALVDKASLNGYGYGDIYETQEPYSKYVRKYPIQWNVAKFSGISGEVNSSNSTACSGDSGGAITVTLATGEEVLIAVMSGAARVVERCGTATNGTFTMRVTVVNQYLNLVASELNSSKSSPSPSASSTPSPTASPSLTQPTTKSTPKPIIYKITCLKGKTKKYLTGTNPKCPTGYKQTSKVRIS